MKRLALFGVVLVLALWIARTYAGANDFHWATDAATALLAGRDPYAFTPTAALIPYPLPAAAFGFPALALPELWRGPVFAATGVALLVAVSPGRWAVLYLLTMPVLAALRFGQWTGWIAAAWYVPALAPVLVICKPHVTLPVALSGRLSRTGMAIAALILAATVLVYPAWPVRWAGMLGQFQYRIPVFDAWGWVLLLPVLVRPGSRRARFVALAALMPQRGYYDLVPWLATVDGLPGIAAMIAASWSPRAAIKTTLIAALSALCGGL